MNSTISTARQAGATYLVFSILAILGEFCFPTFMVPGDAAATARNILAAEPAYRLSILTSFVTLAAFIALVVILYKLFKGVDESQARLMVLLVSVGVAVSLANGLHRFAPLVFLDGGDPASVFSRDQRAALALDFLRLHAKGASFSMAFWGLWLFPFGILVLKSGFIPRVFGFLLFAAGTAYVVGSATAIALPEYRSVVSRFMTPLYFGEVPIIFWLLIKGARAPRAEARAAEVG